LPHWRANEHLVRAPEAFLIVLLTSPSPQFAVISRITANISQGFRCYSALAADETSIFLRPPTSFLAVSGGIISQISQADLSRYWSALLTDRLVSVRLVEAARAVQVLPLGLVLAA
jgi:hypothetical protein